MEMGQPGVCASLVLACITAPSAPTPTSPPASPSVPRSRRARGGGHTRCLACSSLPASHGHPSPSCLPFTHHTFRDSPGLELEVVVERQGERLSIPVTPALSPKDNTGRIGIQLASNTDIQRKVAGGPVQAVTLAAEECAKLTSIVLKGE